MIWSRAFSNRTDRGPATSLTLVMRASADQPRARSRDDSGGARALACLAGLRSLCLQRSALGSPWLVAVLVA